MKKQFFYTMLTVGALVGLAGCSDNDSLTSIDSTTQTSDETPVSFGTYLGGAKSTRAAQAKTGAITNDLLKTTGYGFGVVAYNTGTTKYESASAPTEYYMENQKVEYSTANSAWEYSPLKYWPNQTWEDGKQKDQFVSFFAYAPYEANAEKNNNDNDHGILDLKKASEYEGEDLSSIKKMDFDPVIYYTAAKCATSGDNEGKQVDLLWGTTGTNGKPDKVSTENNSGSTNAGVKYGDLFNVNADLTKMNVDKGQNVDFAFKHALAKFGGNDGTDKENITIDANADVVRTAGSGNGTIDGKTKVYVDWVAIVIENGDAENASIPIRGKFDLATGKWLPATNTSTTAGDVQKQFIYLIKPKSGDGSTLSTILKDLKDATTIEPTLKTGTTAATSESDYTDLVVADMNTALRNSSTLTTSGTGTNFVISNSESGVTTSAQDLLAAGTTTGVNSPILFIPGFTPKIKVIVSYGIYTADETLKAKYSTAHQVQVQDATFTKALELNKKYKLQLHLGLTSIKVNAKVDDWDNTASEGNTDMNKDVDLPLNVSASTTTPATPEP